MEEEKPKIILTQKNIRTYESDMAEALAKGQASMTSMAIAESKRKEGTESLSSAPAQNYAKQIILGLLSIVLVGSGIVGAYMLYLRSPFATPKVASLPLTMPSIIPADKQITFAIDEIMNGKLISQIYTQFNKNMLPPGKILEILIEESASGNTNKIMQTRVTGSSFIKRLAIDMPDVLWRSITDRWMFGIYAEENGQQTPFIALTTDFFQNAFAGMLAWEKSMPEELADLLHYRQKATRGDGEENIDSNGIAVMTSTSVSSYFNIQGQFTDHVIRNRDVREFRNNSGALLFLYSFINKETLLITTTESAFMAEVDRIEKETYVR